MASLPHRRTQTPVRVGKQHSTPLQTLLQMGFAKHRAEKALAATGNCSVQQAADWLLAHINDPFLDEIEPREYVLYACPTGPFLKQLETFWAESKELCGWNGAHNCLPHITLVSFFKAPDECEPEISKTLKRIIDHANNYLKRPLEIELFTNNTFMGLFVTENDANYLKRIALQYVKEVSPSIISDTYEQLDAIVACFPWCGGVTSNTRCIPRSSRSISLEPHVKSLHLTLAYKFADEHTNTLKQLVERLDLSTATTWELRLYSRDTRITSKQIYKVVQSYEPREQDELELQMNDLICVTDEAVEHSNDGWVEGFSCSTGCNGHFPLSYTIRVPESDAWTLHCNIQICSSPSGTSFEQDSQSEHTYRNGSADVRNSTRKSYSDDAMTRSATQYSSLPENDRLSNQSLPNAQQPPEVIPSRLHELNNAKNVQGFYRKFIIWDPSVGKFVKPPNNRQKLFIMRHGERVDFTFSKWVQNCFDSRGTYYRLDLNMPKLLPQRQNIPEVWRNDSPITNIGIHQAELSGDMFKDVGLTIEYAYSSPAYRCIQTCHALLKGLGVTDFVKIRVEPALFEWCSWYPERIPQFLTIPELLAAGYNIDTDYLPLVNVSDLETHYKTENLQEFYERNHLVSEHVTQTIDKNVLLVGHAANIETNSRLLVGGKSRKMNEIAKLMGKVSYASLLTIEKANENQWQIVAPNVYPISHNKNFHFDWREFAEDFDNFSVQSESQQSNV